MICPESDLGKFPLESFDKSSCERRAVSHQKSEGASPGLELDPPDHVLLHKLDDNHIASDLTRKFRIGLTNLLLGMEIRRRRVGRWFCSASFAGSGMLHRNVRSVDWLAMTGGLTDDSVKAWDPEVDEDITAGDEWSRERMLQRSQTRRRARFLIRKRDVLTRHLH